MPMRNDANDDFDDVPSLRMRADIPDDDDFMPNRQPHVQARPAPVAAAKVKGPSTGPLWALIGALLCAFAFLAWWSFQQISLMEQQLVATQESFARISEDAAGRLQDISGKVVAGQSNVMSDSEALKLQRATSNSAIERLEQDMVVLKSQQDNRSGNTAEFDAFRGQVTRNINTLQSQIQYLQQQLSARSQ